MISVKKIGKESAFWFGSILIAILALIIFLMIPLENRSLLGTESKKIYYVDNISRAHQIIIDKFNTEYANEIEVVPVDLPFSKFSTNERKEILARSLRSKSERIDVFSIDIIWGPRFARWSYPLDSFIKEEEIKKINKRALQTCYYENKLIAVPLYIDVSLLYYRKDLLKQFANSELIENNLKNSMRWSDFINLGQQWNDKNPYYIFAGDSFEGLVCSFHEMLSAGEINRIFGSSRVELNTDEAKRGLQLLTNLIGKFGYTPLQVTNYDEFKCYRYALENNALFLRGWSGLHQQYQDQIEDSNKLEQIGMAPLPHFDNEIHSSVFGGWNLMVSKFSENKSGALQFIKYLQKDENQKLLFEIGGYIPVNMSLYEDQQFLDKNPQFSSYLKLLDYGKYRPMRADYTLISDILSHYLHAALRAELQVPDALTEATAKINAQQVFIK